MRSALLRVSSLILLIMLFTGCNSTLYDIVEIEEPVEIKPEVKTTENDIKSDIETSTLSESTSKESTTPESSSLESTSNNTELNPSVNKFSDKEVISQKYVIQVGAYNQMSNASSCERRAQNKLAGQDVYMKEYEDGLYKVRFGNFASKTEAINYLSVVQKAGFSDSFVLEVSTVKVAK